jgi:hypothetical protein
MTREPLHVCKDRAENVLDDRLPPSVRAAVGHAFRFLPLDVGSHRAENRIDITAGERVIELPPVARTPRVWGQ